MIETIIILYCTDESIKRENELTAGDSELKSGKEKKTFPKRRQGCPRVGK